MRNIKRRSDCPISFALDTFGDKWSLLVIRDLMFRGKSSYGEFLKSEEGIATNVLVDRLRTLERSGIVERAKDKQDNRKDIYNLTEKGIDLLPVLVEVVLWSAKYDPRTGAPKEFIANARGNKEKFLRDIRKNLEKFQNEIQDSEKVFF